MSLRRIAGAAVMVLGVVLMAWGIRNHNDPLVVSTFKNYGTTPVHGQSDALNAFAYGLVALWVGWMIYSPRAALRSRDKTDTH